MTVIKPILRHAVGIICVLLTVSFAPTVCLAVKPLHISDIFGTYLKMHSYQGVVKTTTSLTPLKGSGGATNIYSTIKLEFKSPNRLHIDILGLTGGAQMVSDGSTTYAYSAMTNSYSSQPAPKSPLAILTETMGVVSGLHSSGQRIVNGHPCNIYSGTTMTQIGRGSVTIAVDINDKLVQNLIVVMPSLVTPRGGKFRLTVNEDYTQQQVNTQISPSEFRFQPPPGAQKSQESSLPSILGLSGVGIP